LTSYSQFLLNSALLIGALLALYYLVGRLGVKGGRGVIKVVDRAPLSRDGGLIVFEVEGVRYLGFYSKDNFKILKELKNEEDIGGGFNSDGGLRGDDR